MSLVKQPIATDTQLRDRLRVYLITDRRLLPPGKFLPALEQALKGGVRAVQLREKDLPAAELGALARDVRALTQAYGAWLFINSRAEIAAEAGAEGVHLPDQASAPGALLKFPHLRVGVSTHSPERARQAEAEGADFVTFSPVFATPSKAIYGPPQGVGRLQETARAVTIPVLALGGIDAQKIAGVRQAGAAGVAVVSDIWNSADIETKVRDYISLFGGSFL